MKLTLINTVTVITLFQTLFLATVFLSYKKQNNLSNKLFSTLLLAFGISVSCLFSCSAGVYLDFIKYHKPIFLISKISFTIGPLLYLYVKSTLIPDLKLDKKHLLHLIPFVAIELYAISLILPVKRFIIWYSPLEVQTSIAVLLQNLIYLIFTLLEIRNHHSSIRSFFSQCRTEKQIWLRLIISGFIALWILNMQSFVLLQILHIVQWCGYSASLNFVYLFLFLNGIAYLSWKSPAIFSNGKKYQKSGLDATNKEKYKIKLVSLMNNKKPYLDPLLNSKKLAEMITIPVPYLSQILNECFQQNYSDFVNQYRIEEIKRLLQLSDERTILEIAYAVGFNSKATFNSVFKKFTNQTPKQYRTLYTQIEPAVE